MTVFIFPSTIFYDLLKLNIRAELHRLRNEVIRKFAAAYLRYSRIIFDSRRRGYLTAEGLALGHEHGFSRSERIDCRRESGSAGTDDNDIKLLHFFSL